MVPTKNPSAFTNEEEEDLIRQVQDTTSLWNKMDSGYKKRDKSIEWKAIGVKMLKSESDCKLVWTSLRQQYAAFLRKLSKPSGSAKGQRPSFRHESLMGFVKDQIAPDESSMSNVQNENTESVFEETEVFEIMQSEESTTPTTTDPQHRPHTSWSQKKRRKSSEEFDNNLLNLLKTKEDEFEVFGKLVAEKCRSVATKQKRKYLELQRDIMARITEVELDLEGSTQ